MKSVVHVFSVILLTAFCFLDRSVLARTFPAIAPASGTSMLDLRSEEDSSYASERALKKSIKERREPSLWNIRVGFYGGYVYDWPLKTGTENILIPLPRMVDSQKEEMFSSPVVGAVTLEGNLNFHSVFFGAGIDVGFMNLQKNPKRGEGGSRFLTTKFSLPHYGALFVQGGIFLSDRFLIGIRGGAVAAPLKVHFTVESMKPVLWPPLANKDTWFHGGMLGAFGRMKLMSQIDLEISYVYMRFLNRSLDFAPSALMNVSFDVHQIRGGIGLSF